MDTAPRMMITMAITIANTGRSMKKRAMELEPRFLLGTERLRSYLHSRPDSQLALDDDFIAGLQALLHDPVIAYALPCLYRVRLHLVSGADGIDRLYILDLLHGTLRHQDCIFALIRPEAHPPKLARQQAALGIRKTRLHLERSRARIHL